MDEMDEELKLSLEKEATGLYLSGHPMSKYSALYKKRSITEIVKVISGDNFDGRRITVAGVISQLKSRQLKNGNILASAVIEDITASMPITIFSKAFIEYKAILSSSQPVILSGKVSAREEKETEIICEKVELIPESLIKNDSVKKYKSGLYIKVSSINGKDFANIKEILAKYKGDLAVYIICLDTNKKLEAPHYLRINPTSDLMGELSLFLGEDNIKLIK